MPGQRRAPSFALIVMAVRLAACSQPSPTVPSAPVLVVTPVSGITISGLPSSSVTVGQSFQLSASVTLPNGAQKQTLDAVWQSSDTAVATVLPSGLLAIVAGGVADVTATTDEVSTTRQLVVLYRVAGMVHESAPTVDVPIAGARVEVRGGSDIGKSTTTDSAGRFTLDVASAGFDLSVTKADYDQASSAIAALPRDQHPDVALVPAFSLVREVFEFTLYPGCSVTAGAGHASRDFEFAVHHDGTVTLEESIIQSFEYSTTLYQGENLIFGLGQCLNSSPNRLCPRSEAVDGGFHYRFRVGASLCQPNTRFRLEFTHPN